jgi:hypothetical protein
MKFLVGEEVFGFEIIDGCCSDQGGKPARQYLESGRGLRILFNMKLEARTVLATNMRL